MIRVGSNPTKPVVEEGGRFAKENGCDFIVALGGGSVMDASKAIGIMATNESDDLWDYVKCLEQERNSGRQCHPFRLLPSLQLPEQDQKLMEAV